MRPTASSAGGQNAQQTLGVNPALVLLNPDAALELVRLADEVGGGPRAKTKSVGGSIASSHCKSSIAVLRGRTVAGWHKLRRIWGYFSHTRERNNEV